MFWTNKTTASEALLLIITMKFFIEDLPVLFPYPKIYPEQYQYMSAVKKTLDTGGVSILEMPSGTGKTVSLLSVTVAYQMFYPSHRKIVYCSRTMSEIDKALAELENLMRYREQELGFKEDFRGLGLTSRKNLCIHPKVRQERNGLVVDDRCRNMTNGIAKENGGELCEFHENMYEIDPHNYIPPGVYTFEDLIEYCEEHKTCPYFTVRRMIPYCNIVIYSFHYLLDPKIAVRVSRDLPKEAIVIFDEAHNIDNVCIESLSIDLTEDSLRRAHKGINSLGDAVDKAKQQDRNKLQSEYEKLVEGLQQTQINRDMEVFMANPTLPDDLAADAIPGSIRKAEHFVAFLRRLVEYLKTRMKILHVISETPASFLKHLKEITYIDKKPLRYCTERLNSLVRTLELTNLDEFTAIKDLVTFATLVSSYEQGFLLILAPFETEQATAPNPILRFTCLDASIAIKPVIE